MHSSQSTGFITAGGELQVKWGCPLKTRSSGEATREEWERHRGRITELYTDHMLPEVMRIIEEETGFRASAKSFKDHIAKWGLNNKRLNEPCVLSIICKRKRRADEGKRSVFRYRDRTIDYEEVEKYIGRRKKFTESFLEELQTRRPPTPEGLEVSTPSSTDSHPSPPIPPLDMVSPCKQLALESGPAKVPHLVLDAIQTFFVGYYLEPTRKPLAIDSEHDLKVSTDERCRLMKMFEDFNKSRSPIVLPHSIVHEVPKGRLPEEVDLSKKDEQSQLTAVVNLLAFSTELVIEGVPSSIKDVLYHLRWLAYNLDSQTNRNIIQHVAQLSFHILGKCHPLSKVFSLLLELETSEIQDAVRMCWHLLKDILPKSGSMHIFWLDLSLNCHSRDSSDHGEHFFKQLLLLYGDRYVWQDPRRILIEDHLAEALYANGHFEEAETRTLAIISTRIEEMPDKGLDSYFFKFIYKGSVRISNCRRQLNDLRRAIEFLYFAISFATNYHDFRESVLSLRSLVYQWQKRNGQPISIQPRWFDQISEGGIDYFMFNTLSLALRIARNEIEFEKGVFRYNKLQKADLPTDAWEEHCKRGGDLSEEYGIATNLRFNRRLFHQRLSKHNFSKGRFNHITPCRFWANADQEELELDRCWETQLKWWEGEHDYLDSDDVAMCLGVSRDLRRIPFNTQTPSITCEFMACEECRIY